MKRKLITILIGVAIVGAFAISAKNITINKNINDISKVDYDCPGKLHIKQGNKEELKIIIEEKYKDKINVDSRGDTLYLKKEHENSWFSSDEIKPEIYLTLKKLEYLKNESVGDVIINSFDINDDFIIRNQSVGNISIDGVNCKDFSAYINSTGDVNIKGEMNCKDSDLHISSTGCFSANAVNAKEVDVRIGSTGTFKAEKLNVSGDFEARLSSTGDAEINKLYSKDIEVICSSTGSFYAVMEGAQQQNTIELKTSSTGGITLEGINAENVESTISSCGGIKISGKTEKQTVRISSSGDYQASELASNKAEIRGSSSGTVRINVKDYLNLRTSGSGSVYLKGSPKMNLNTSGSGRLISE